MITRNLTISSTYESLRNATNAVRSVLSEAGIADEVIGICELAVQELLTNLVEHAYKEDTTKSIKIFISFDNNRFLVETEDFGETIKLDLDAIQMPDPTDLQVGGYGIAILKSLMDRVEYTRKDGKNIWRIEKLIFN